MLMTSPDVACEPAATFVFEFGYKLLLVRSENVFAVGLDADTPGVLVRFCNHRDTGRLYLYRGAGQAELDELLAAPSKHHYVREQLEPRFEYDLISSQLRHPLKESWSLCDRCDAVIDPTDRVGSVGESCPSCGQAAPEDFAIDRCEVCKTYFASWNGGNRLRDACH